MKKLFDHLDWPAKSRRCDEPSNNSDDVTFVACTGKKLRLVGKETTYSNAMRKLQLHIPSGKLLPKTIWKDPPCISHGKIHYFDWAIFQFANC